MAYSGSARDRRVSHASRPQTKPQRPRFTHEDASVDADCASTASAKYPDLVRFVIVVGGSALLWAAIAHVIGII